MTANKPVALTGNGYVPLGQAEQPAGKAAGQIAKFNPYHNERGRFTTADNASTEKPTDHGAHERNVAFTGVLIDKRYDEVAGLTHCTYSTPLGTFTVEIRGYSACPDTYPAPH